MIAPEIKSAESEHRNATVSAMSCGEVVPRFFHAEPCSHCSIASSRVPIAGTGPGAIVLTVTPFCHAGSHASFNA